MRDELIAIADRLSDEGAEMIETTQADMEESPRLPGKEMEWGTRMGCGTAWLGLAQMIWEELGVLEEKVDAGKKTATDFIHT